jgi:hypothetical protein
MAFDSLDGHHPGRLWGPSEFLFHKVAGLKQPRREADDCPLNAEVRNERSYISTPTWIFVAWRLATLRIALRFAFPPACEYCKYVLIVRIRGSHSGGLSEMKRHVVRWKSTVVSEEHFGSIFRVQEWAKKETRLLPALLWFLAWLIFRPWRWSHVFFEISV